MRIQRDDSGRWAIYDEDGNLIDSVEVAPTPDNGSEWVRRAMEIYERDRDFYLLLSKL